ncbi:hypothetical protein HHK36_009323 [Tetracentron sinense]|uniref:FAD-binding domain-containing protein n=1 Tax=Tetracentron sinense TaxID=13715 RepID=A0A834ZG18_TETSI|nr:hypothetical protein HHK36_009323 [Tetracentron sinense]
MKEDMEKVPTTDGLATALALKRVGVRALILEKSDGLRATGAALTLFPNAWTALEALGVAHKLTSLYAPFTKGYITNIVSGAIQDVPFAGNNGSGDGPRTVHRRTLLEALVEELPIDTIRFSSKAISIETHTEEGSSITILRMEDGTIIKAKVLVGCDGVHSVVAQWLGLKAPVHSGRSAVRGLAVFPQGHGLNHEVQQFLDLGIRVGFVPLNDKEFYWFITFKSSPKDEEMIGKPELMLKEVIENFAKHVPQIFLEVVRHSDLSTVTWAPLMFRLPWDLIFGQACKGNITVAGDAMHPMTPDLGQGGCAALEDAVVLSRNIGNSLRNGKILSVEVVGALERYVKERRWRAAGLITGSFLSGWVQQGRSGWLMKFFRDMIFYRFIFGRIVNVIRYDCGKLPSVLDCDTKVD